MLTNQTTTSTSLTTRILSNTASTNRINSSQINPQRHIRKLHIIIQLSTTTITIIHVTTDHSRHMLSTAPVTTSIRIRPVIVTTQTSRMLNISNTARRLRTIIRTVINLRMLSSNAQASQPRHRQIRFSITKSRTPNITSLRRTSRTQKVNIIITSPRHNQINLRHNNTTQHHHHVILHRTHRRRTTPQAQLLNQTNRRSQYIQHTLNRSLQSNISLRVIRTTNNATSRHTQLSHSHIQILSNTINRRQATSLSLTLRRMHHQINRPGQLNSNTQRRTNTHLTLRHHHTDQTHNRKFNMSTNQQTVTNSTNLQLSRTRVIRQIRIQANNKHSKRHHLTTNIRTSQSLSRTQHSLHIQHTTIPNTTNRTRRILILRTRLAFNSQRINNRPRQITVTIRNMSSHRRSTISPTRQRMIRFSQSIQQVKRPIPLSHILISSRHNLNQHYRNTNRHRKHSNNNPLRSTRLRKSPQIKQGEFHSNAAAQETAPQRIEPKK